MRFFERLYIIDELGILKSLLCENLILSRQERLLVFDCLFESLDFLLEFLNFLVLGRQSNGLNLIPKILPTNFAVVLDDRIDLLIELVTVLHKFDAVLSSFKLRSRKYFDKCLS